jgi:hypothetical protein
MGVMMGSRKLLRAEYQQVPWSRVVSYDYRCANLTLFELIVKSILFNFLDIANHNEDI